jgi:hypothetical protein
VRRGAIPILVLGLCLLAPGAAVAQLGPPSERPRAVDIFGAIDGYDDVAQPDRYGTVMDPARNELGLYLVTRAFRNVCLGLEGGRPLDAVMPPLYAAYGQSAYYFGDETAADTGNLVLSPTGDIDADEDDGHPTFWLRPAPGGMTCQMEWTFAPELDESRQDAMAHFLEDWLPFAFALVPANRHEAASGSPLFGFAEWDRSCLGRWCPMTVNFRLGAASITIGTTLNITGIEGTAP